MHAKKTNKRKLAALLLALALLMGCAAGATLAWLVDTTDPVVNTFTVGDINITLTETDAIPGTNQLEKSFKMVPGTDIDKDPTVTVVKDSEDCWLFVKVEESDNFPVFLSYAINDGEGEWKLLESGVYYREVKDITANKSFAILKDNVVKVADTATKTELAAYKTNPPTLKFTAYAVQKAKVDTAAEAWAIANP